MNRTIRQSYELIGVDADGRAEWGSSIESFLSVNEDDPETCDAVRALEPGDKLVLGGGACPQITVRRRPERADG